MCYDYRNRQFIRIRLILNILCPKFKNIMIRYLVLPILERIICSNFLPGKKRRGENEVQRKKKRQNKESRCPHPVLTLIQFSPCSSSVDSSKISADESQINYSQSRKRNFPQTYLNRCGNL